MEIQRWWTFALSPVGWVAIALGLMLVAMMLGGGAGGLSGSLTPNLLGGFTLRLWR